MRKVKRHTEKPATTPWYQAHSKNISILEVVRETKSSLIVLHSGLAKGTWYEHRIPKEDSFSKCFATPEEAVSHLRTVLTEKIADLESELGGYRETLAQLKAMTYLRHHE